MTTYQIVTNGKLLVSAGEKEHDCINFYRTKNCTIFCKSTMSGLCALYVRERARCSLDTHLKTGVENIAS